MTVRLGPPRWGKNQCRDGRLRCSARAGWRLDQARARPRRSGALAPLVLFDETLSVVAASPFLRGTGAPLAHFGWLFDPAINPELSRLAQRFRTLAPSTPVLSLEIPYSHEARPWACFGRLTVNTVGADLFAIGELSFVHDTAQRIEAIALRAAARPGMGTGPDRA